MQSIRKQLTALDKLEEKIKFNKSFKSFTGIKAEIERLERAYKEGEIELLRHARMLFVQFVLMLIFTIIQTKSFLLGIGLSVMSSIFFNIGLQQGESVKNKLTKTKGGRYFLACVSKTIRILNMVIKVLLLLLLLSIVGRGIYLLYLHTINGLPPSL